MNPARALPDIFEELRGLQRRSRPRAPALSSAPTKPDAASDGSADELLLAEAAALVVSRKAERCFRWKAIAQKWLLEHSSFPVNAADIPAWYAGLLSQSLSADITEQIDKDLGRTWYTDLDPAGLLSLSNVLRAAAAATPSVGYTQGMNFIGAVCLHVCSGDEPAAVTVMLCMLSKIAVDYFSPGLVGAVTDVASTHELIALVLPELVRSSGAPKHGNLCPRLLRIHLLQMARRTSLRQISSIPSH